MKVPASCRCVGAAINITANVNNPDSSTLFESYLLIPMIISGPDIVQDTPMSNITEVEEDRNMKRKTS